MLPRPEPSGCATRKGSRPGASGVVSAMLAGASVLRVAVAPRLDARHEEADPGYAPRESSPRSMPHRGDSPERIVVQGQPGRSRLGGTPNLRAYSRLNWLGLS